MRTCQLLVMMFVCATAAHAGGQSPEVSPPSVDGPSAESSPHLSAAPNDLEGFMELLAVYEATSSLDGSVLGNRLQFLFGDDFDMERWGLSVHGDTDAVGDCPATAFRPDNAPDGLPF